MTRTPPTIPIRAAAHGATNPDPGVMTTKPVITPEQNERPEILRVKMKSKKVHDKAENAEQMDVTKPAIPARGVAARADPELKPIHPNQSSPVPKNKWARLDALCSDTNFLFPTNKQKARPAKPFTSEPMKLIIR